MQQKKNYQLLALPKLYDIRWTEFSHTIVHNLLRSWRALMHYFDANKDTNATEMGFFTFLSQLKNLRLIAFIADLLQIFSRYHKKTQDNKLTMISLVQHIRSLKNALTDLKEENLLGGWEDTLLNDLERDEEGIFTLKGFEISEGERSRRATVTTVDFSSTRNNIIDTIVDCLDERFKSDEEIVETIEPFVNFSKTANLRQIHRLFGTDIDLSSLQLQFNELVDQKIAMRMNGDMGEIIKTIASNSNYEDILTILSRIYVCTPHSADVERCISANNLIKTPLRNRVVIETENKYLYIYFNMPALENWNPRPAIKQFMDEKNRKDYSNVIQRKATHAPNLKGIFAAAEIETEPEVEVHSQKIF